MCSRQNVIKSWIDHRSRRRTNSEDICSFKPANHEQNRSLIRAKYSITGRSNLTLNTIPAIVVPVFLAVGSLAPIFSSMAFLRWDQKVRTERRWIKGNSTFLKFKPFAVFERKSAMVFLSNNSPNSRHFGKFSWSHP